MSRVFTQAELDLEVADSATKLAECIKDSDSPLVDLCALHLTAGA